MSLLSKYKRSQKLHKGNDAQDRIANDIVQKCIQAQEQWAAFMQRKSERFSTKAKKFLFIMFLLLSAGCSLYLIVEGLISHKHTSFSIALIKVPQYLDKAGDENTKASGIVSQAEYERIHRFQLYMDSLAKSPSGKRLFDSILNKRPGLMNSIMMIQRIYKKNSGKNY